ncbi:hypothetical protein NSS78_03160 [Bacillus sp. FSL W8-0920]|uniref:hypothetical protein n=1 Tax=Bacillus TaxID=1386 RepID=UPI000680F721|nr:hypothetical protein [Bacillus pumilus]KMY19140.1 hypothetical protein TW93_16875 [Bacillus pumilus]MCI4618971.1 hypothetical protein [Bacillus pumilus]MDR0122638.1 hypothetical protein [Bacillus pumilus]
MILSSIRKISKYSINTPLIVPSFSSKGFPYVKDLYNYIKPKLTDVSLISAFDLYYKFIDENDIFPSEILFIDSGGYERNKEHDISDIYNESYIPSKWDETLYYSLIKNLKYPYQKVLVNYDYNDGQPILIQIEKAIEIFGEFPQFASDFLFKPSNINYKFIKPEDIIKHYELLKKFDIIGFTEKELGSSILERAKNLYSIRKSMRELNLETPIHIFGCSDPLSIILYFICGADIFDGLSWLRFSFNNYKPTYFNHYAIESSLWDRNDSEVKFISYIENLDLLNKLNRDLVTFAETRNLESLNLSKYQLEGILKIYNRVLKEMR